MPSLRTSRKKPIVGSNEDDDDERIEETFLIDPDPLVIGEEDSVPSKLHIRKTKTATSGSPASSQRASASPAKSRVVGNRKSSSRTKEKTTAAKPRATKPIYSFFNAETEKQRSTQPSTSPEKRPATQVQGELEAILDDSDDEFPSLVALSKGSSTAVALRKRKTQRERQTDVGPVSQVGPVARQKFRKANDGERTPSFTVVNEDKRPWTEQFAPTDLTELAVHTRKVRDVRQWLESAFNGRRQKVLLLKGAAGAGKTTTIQLLAKEMGFSILNWQNPAGSDWVVEGSATASVQFEEFLGRAGRAGSLALSIDQRELPISAPQTESQQVLLVEEFPSTFARNSGPLLSFRSSILQYVSMPPVSSGSPTPVVLVVSETLLSTNTSAADSFTAHRLLGPELSNHPYVNSIEFNPIAPTILTKALENIIIREARKSGRRKAPGPHVIKHLVDTGDIRSAVSSLEFLCLRGDDEQWSTKVSFTKTKKSKVDAPLTKEEEAALMLVSNRETTVGIFHAAGRILYNNRVLPANSNDVPQPPSHLPQHRRPKVPERAVNALNDELGTDTSTFVATLHENYVPSCGGLTAEDTLATLADCIDALADADILSADRFSSSTRPFTSSAIDSLRQDEMTFQVAARGLLFNLPHPVHRKSVSEGRRGDAFRMYYPASLRLWKKREEVASTIDILTGELRRGKIRGFSSTQSKISGTGVESWKSSSSEDSAGSSQVPSLSKNEMLLERLPYLGRIIPSDDIRTSSCGRQILSVVRLQGNTQSHDDGDDQTGPDEEDAFGLVEPWSTDKPESDVEGSKKQIKGILKRRPKQETEGGGLAIPVEHNVERLVLEDDDISD